MSAEGLFLVRFWSKAKTEISLTVGSLAGQSLSFFWCDIVNVRDKFFNFLQPLFILFRMAASVLSFVDLHFLLWRWFFKEFLESVAFLHLLLHKSFYFFLFECPLKLMRKDMKSSWNILLLCLNFRSQGHCSISESIIWQAITFDSLK